ncbi:MAG TPA: phage holin family protein [Acidimicrobiales bacterium]|nr:phage holin family protein [Acidimicrobiales bacterium]
MAAASDTEDVRGRVSETVDLLKRYFLQETVGPLKNLGRSLGLGIAGSLLLGAGVLLLLVAGLRALQEETGTFHGNWTWVPYLIVAAGGIVLAALAVVFAAKRPLSKDKH